MKEIEVSAQALSLQILILAVQAPKDIEAAFQTASNGRAGASSRRLPRPTFSTNTGRRPRGEDPPPGNYSREEFVEAGVLWLRAEPYRPVPPRRYLC